MGQRPVSGEMGVGTAIVQVPLVPRAVDDVERAVERAVQKVAAWTGLIIRAQTPCPPQGGHGRWPGCAIVKLLPCPSSEKMLISSNALEALARRELTHVLYAC